MRRGVQKAGDCASGLRNCGKEVIMVDRVCKGLVWDIRKRLLNLSAVELFQVAKSIGPIPERDFSELDTEDQEGCLEYINAFMYSTLLLESEDRGMTELLVLQGTVEAVVQEHGAAEPCHCHGEVESNVDVNVCPAPTSHTHTSTGHMMTTDTVHVESPENASDLGKVRGLDTNPSTNPTVRHSDFEDLSRKLIQYLTPHIQHRLMMESKRISVKLNWSGEYYVQSNPVTSKK